MKHSIIALLVLALASPALAEHHDAAAGIEAKNAELMAAIRAGDVAAAAGSYTRDARLLPPNSPVLQGREAITAFWAAGMEAIKGLELTTLEVLGQGEIVSEVGLYKIFGADGQEMDHGKYLVVWKKEDGDWKLHWDIFNSSRPLPDP